MLYAILEYCCFYGNYYCHYHCKSDIHHHDITTGFFLSLSLPVSFVYPLALVLLLRPLSPFLFLLLFTSAYSQVVHHVINPSHFNPTHSLTHSFFLSYSLFFSNSYITGSVFWSTLVSWVNGFARLDSLPKDQQNYLSVIILLMFLLILPFIFDTLARNYEGMKLESEIQNTIMTR